jgi:hypothetical protein
MMKCPVEVGLQGFSAQERQASQNDASMRPVRTFRLSSKTSLRMPVSKCLMIALHLVRNLLNPSLGLKDSAVVRTSAKSPHESPATASSPRIAWCKFSHSASKINSGRRAFRMSTKRSRTLAFFRVTLVSARFRFSVNWIVGRGAGRTTTGHVENLESPPQARSNFWASDLSVLQHLFGPVELDLDQIQS